MLGRCPPTSVKGLCIPRSKQFRARRCGQRSRRLRAPPGRCSLPSHRDYGIIAAYYIVATAEASSNLARYDGVRFLATGPTCPRGGWEEMYRQTRAEGFGPEVRRRIMLGTYVLSAG